MPSRPLNRRRFEVAADGHPGTCGRVAAFNGCNAALGQTGTLGHEPPLAVSRSRHSTSEFTGLPSLSRRSGGMMGWA